MREKAATLWNFEFPPVFEPEAVEMETVESTDPEMTDIPLVPEVTQINKSGAHRWKLGMVYETSDQTHSKGGGKLSNHPSAVSMHISLPKTEPILASSGQSE
ncbi:hypothetical protein ACFO25_13765 [Paenactinomyces guangxiensis]|uniref:Uncharacterized protein n=1 Tax=Paenactinomyces guangxiensis TaxID=1490290 RepID=A0A7W1WP74_9BACL|nr:hypothetical protein [Paenactinomyces guangxiensis]MBA4493512.1 hypothetical protein [Paenactinomyces guangxiensis]MBH8590603.1 hypothetical protein [Paenactinomyces guangxiensis]